MRLQPPIARDLGSHSRANSSNRAGQFIAQPAMRVLPFNSPWPDREGSPRWPRGPPALSHKPTWEAIMKLREQQHPPAQGPTKGNSGAGPGGRTVSEERGSAPSANPGRSLLQYLDDGYQRSSRILPTRAQIITFTSRTSGNVASTTRTSSLVVPLVAVSCCAKTSRQPQMAGAGLPAAWLRSGTSFGIAAVDTRRIVSASATGGLPRAAWPSLLTGATTSRHLQIAARNGPPRRHGSDGRGIMHRALRTD